MFVDPTYLQVDDGSSKDEGYNDDMVEGVSAIDISGLLAMDDNDPFYYDIVENHEAKRSFTPMEWTLSWLRNTMVKIAH
jgi:hypothetical protein